MLLNSDSVLPENVRRPSIRPAKTRRQTPTTGKFPTEVFCRSFSEKGQRPFFVQAQAKTNFLKPPYLCTQAGRPAQILRFWRRSQRSLVLSLGWVWRPSTTKATRKRHLQKSCCFGFSEVGIAKMISFLQAFPSEISRFNAIILRYSLYTGELPGLAGAEKGCGTGILHVTRGRIQPQVNRLKPEASPWQGSRGIRRKGIAVSFGWRAKHWQFP